MQKLIKNTYNSLGLLIILLLTAVCYIPSLDNNFVNYDDPTNIFENTIINDFSISNIKNIFESMFAGHYSRFNPLVFIIFMTIKHFAGTNPFWFHAVNFVFHLGTTLVVFFLAKEITQNLRLSFFCSLLFGVHPIHVEPVVWISALNHGMYTFFYLLSLYFFCAAQNNKRNQTLFTCLSLVIFAIAGMSFSGGVITLPAIFLLILYFKENNWRAKQLISLIPFFLLNLYFIYLTFFTAKTADVITNPYFNIDQQSLLTRVNLSVMSLLQYLQQIFLPYNFAMEYPDGYYLPICNIAISLSFVLLVILLTAFKGRFFQWRYFNFGFFFFLITIAPYLKIYSTSGSITNDRYCYLASFGLFLWLAELIDTAMIRYQKNTTLIKIILVSSFIYLIIVTITMSLNWKNGEMLWTQLIKTSPRTFPAYLGRADYYMHNGSYTKALEDCDNALEYNPEYTNALYLKATILYRIKDYDNAIKTFSKLLNLDPKHTQALNYRGTIYMQLGKNNLALNDFNGSIKLDAAQIDPYLNRASIYIQDRKYENALIDLRTILKQTPDYQPAINKMREIENQQLTL